MNFKNICFNSLYRKIFRNLRRDIEIEYFMHASNHTLIDIFFKAKALLFPSNFEGLGLPIIEAQVCGLPVMVKNKPPMNSLVLEGGLFVQNTPEESAKLLDELFKNFSNNEGLKENARKVFSQDELSKFLMQIVT